MQFQLTISLDNAEAADERPEHPDVLARYLREVASHVQSGYGQGRVRDINGNTIGEYEITGD